MRKCLLFVALLIVSQLNLLHAQGLFTAPDTVCRLQPVQLVSNMPGAKTHYWGFCSAYAFNKPEATAMGKTFGLDGAATIEIEKEGDNYYGFVINRGISHSFVRLEFGKSLDNIPKVTNYGNMDNVMPANANSLTIVRDETKGNWHVFITAGTDLANSALVRLDFGNSLANTPNVVNFGNLDNLLEAPNGIFVSKEANKWYGFTMNKATNNIIRIEFDTLLSLTPKLFDLGTTTGLSGPNDFAPLLYNGIWYFFTTNSISNDLTRVDMGASLATSTPAGTALGNFSTDLQNPTGIAILRDCDSFHIFITNKQSRDFVRIDAVDILGGPTSFNSNNYGPMGVIVAPSGMSRAIRDHDDIFMFSTNEIDSNLIKIKFAQCKNSDIRSSTTAKPPTFKYDTAGTYNLYYLIDEGLPTMNVQCKLIYVLPTPPIIMSNDTTICQGDTVGLKMLSITATSKTWSPAYNISSITADNVQVWPDFSTIYRIYMTFKNGCIVDTAIRVKVNKVNADAGPDRSLADGATTLLGGPMTSDAVNYTYDWTPKRYILNDKSMAASVNPPFDYTYYLTVTDTSKCTDIDTVVVHVGCNDVNLPNAFAPQGSDHQNRFGLANTQIAKLVFFSIYDRWGKEVFTTTDPTKQWDGKVNGEFAPMGVYIWNVDGFCNSGKRMKKSGNVTLIR